MVIDPRQLLARRGLKPKKKWGQNFLQDGNVCRRIAEGALLSPQDAVLEIGAGVGSLTLALAQTGATVFAVERDLDLVPLLTEEMQPFPNVRVIAADALTLDFAALAAEAGRPLVVTANLPYQITSPLIFAMAAAAPTLVTRAVLMVQREFAERMAAPPGSKVYGRLSVTIQQRAEVKTLFHVAPHLFHPQPAVTSTVVRLAFREPWLAPVKDALLFDRLVRDAFGGRRKMLRRSLEPTFGLDGSEPLGRAFVSAGVAPTRRPEELSVVELARLADALFDEGLRPPAATSPVDFSDDA